MTERVEHRKTALKTMQRDDWIPACLSHMTVTVIQDSKNNQSKLPNLNDNIVGGGGVGGGASINNGSKEEKQDSKVYDDPGKMKEVGNSLNSISKVDQPTVSHEGMKSFISLPYITMV